MPKVIRSPQSKIDLWKIADYIAKDNLAAAVAFLEKVDELLPKLARMPGMGPARDEIKPGLRSFPLGNYLIFYRKIDDGIELARVIHGARKFEELF